MNKINSLRQQALARAEEIQEILRQISELRAVTESSLGKISQEISELRAVALSPETRRQLDYGRRIEAAWFRPDLPPTARNLLKNLMNW